MKACLAIVLAALTLSAAAKGFTLMPLPSTISLTATAPRSKNSTIGAFQTTTAKLPVNENLDYQWLGLFNIGSSAATTSAGVSFTAERDYPVGHAYISLNRSGSPVDNFVLELRTDDETGLPSATVLGSVSIVGSTLLTTSSLIEFNFTSQNIQLTAGERYHLVGKRTGATDSFNFYRWSQKNTEATADIYKVNYSTTLGFWTKTLTNDPGFILTEANVTRSGMVAFLSDETAHTLEAWVSFDQGQTWAERDTAHSRPLSATSAFKGYEATLESADVVSVGSIQSVATGETAYFDMRVLAWRNTDSVAPGTINANVSGVAPWFSEVRSTDSAKVYTYNGATETVATVPYRRIKLQRVGVGTSVDIISGTTTPPGTAVHYDQRFMVEGANGDTLLFWTQSDSGFVMFRRYKSDNTFGPIVTLPAAITNTANYPVGIGTIYTPSGVKKFALPYVDSSDGSLKILRVTADASVDTAANWVSETVFTGATETANSNPAVLVTDAVDGKKLWAFRVPSGRGSIEYTTDRGTATWATPAVFKPAQTVLVGQLNARLDPNKIHLVYLDDSLARVRYDSINVFTAKAPLTGDVMVASEHDLGEDGQLFSGSVDKEAAVGSSFTTKFRTRSDTGCEWDDYPGSITAEDDDTMGEIMFRACRYVRSETTPAGAEVEGGVTGTSDELLPEEELPE